MAWTRADEHAASIPSTYVQAQLDFSSPEIRFGPGPPGFAVHALVENVRLLVAKDRVGVTLAQVTNSSYCLQTSVNGTLLHESGPGGSSTTGPC